MKKITRTKAEILQEIEGFVSFSDWVKKCSASYHISLENEWIKEIRFKFGKKDPYTFDEIKSMALKYLTKTDFCRGNPRAYKRMVHLKIIDECTSHMIPVMARNENHHHVIYCAKFSDGHAYVGQTVNLYKRANEHCHKNKSSVAKHRIQTELSPEFIILEENVKTKNVQEREQYWQDKIAMEFKPLHKAKAGGLGGAKAWTIDSINAAFSNYSSVKEIKKKNPRAYWAASDRKMLPELTSSYKKLSGIQWTIDTAVEKGKQFESIRTWAGTCSGSYQYLLRKNLIEVFFAKQCATKISNDLGMVFTSMWKASKWVHETYKHAFSPVYNAIRGEAVKDESQFFLYNHIWTIMRKSINHPSQATVHSTEPLALKSAFRTDDDLT